MLSRELGIDCSRRCELLLCYAYLAERASLMAIAYRLGNDSTMSAVNLAREMLILPPERARALALSTLKSADVKPPNEVA